MPEPGRSEVRPPGGGDRGRNLSRVRWATGALALGGLGRVGWLSTLSAERLVTLVPDDAFYYLVIADRLVTEGRVSFDGVEPTTGFHALHLWFLAGLRFLFDGLGAPTSDPVAGPIAEPAAAAALKAWLIAVGGVAVLTTTVAFRTLAHWLVPPCGFAALLGLWWVFAGVAMLETHSHLLETPWVVLASAMLLVAVANGRWRRAAVWGVVGGLARFDSGILPAALALGFAVAFGVAWLRRRFDRARAQAIRGQWNAAVAAGLGTALGLGITFAQSFVISGEALPGSARMKLHWADVLGDVLQWAMVFASAAVGGCVVPTVDSWPAWAVAVVGIGALAVIGSRAHRPIACALGGTGLGYLLLYRHGAGLQSWYVAHFLVPVAVLVGWASTAIGRWFGRSRTVARRGVDVLMFTLMASFLGLSVTRSVEPRYRNQSAMWRAGIELSWAPEIVASGVDRSATIGAWNAGIVAFASGRRIVNLDGLVNDTVIPFVRRGALLDYMDRRGVEWIADCDAMWTRDWLARRGGYRPEQFAAGVVRVRSLGEPSSAAERALGVLPALFRWRDPGK